ncbi:hypothetical protein EUX98_g8450 [Antrodiella citrinella]|uniref:Uncharacterized protein n=1 Tax=Antrodiella citrinella TaxID=2447956 RepID=A0A4S4M762_9APHY|nr:hypothetical protein EUX98_g8450 [Antrodiella citrinella]
MDIVEEKKIYDEEDTASVTAYSRHDTSRKGSFVSLPRLQLDDLSLPGPSSGGSGTASSQITPVELLARNSVLGSILVWLRLRKIAASIKDPSTMPAAYYRDLIEVQKYYYLKVNPDDYVHARLVRESWSYSDNAKKKAWSLLLPILDTAHVRDVVKALFTFRSEVILYFLRSVADENPEKPSHDITLTSSLISAIQHERPSLLRDIFRNDLDDFCACLVRGAAPPRLLFGALPLIMEALADVADLSPAHPTCQCRNVLAELEPHAPKEYHPLCAYSHTVNAHLSSWDLPPFAQCLINHIISPDTGTKDLSETVDFIVWAVQLYAREYPDTAILLRYLHPHATHPLLPCIILAIHLAYHSKVAATLLIDHGILQLLGKLWLYDFPDPHGPIPSAPERAVIRMDMRVGCTLLLGALTRHHAGARDVADHLLSFHASKASGFSMSVVSAQDGAHQLRAAHYAWIHVLAAALYPDGSNAIPSLNLFLMENCVANCVPITCTDHPFGNPWRSLMMLLSRMDTNDYCGVVKDAAVRVVLSCASTPETHWQPLLQTFYMWPSKDSHIALYYIVHHFLHPSGDPTSMSEENKNALRRLYKKAVSQGLEIVNPVERFVLLLSKAAGLSPHFTTVLSGVGISSMLSSVTLGFYDFLGDESPSDVQRQSRAATCAKVVHEIDRLYPPVVTPVRRKSTAPTTWNSVWDQRYVVRRDNDVTPPIRETWDFDNGAGRC